MGRWVSYSPRLCCILFFIHLMLVSHSNSVQYTQVLWPESGPPYFCFYYLIIAHRFDTFFWHCIWQPLSKYYSGSNKLLHRISNLSSSVLTWPKSYFFFQGNEWSVVITGSLKEGERQQASYTWQGLLSWGDELQSQTAGVVMAATSPVKTD